MSRKITLIIWFHIDLHIVGGSFGQDKNDKIYIQDVLVFTSQHYVIILTCFR